MARKGKNKTGNRSKYNRHKVENKNPKIYLIPTRDEYRNPILDTIEDAFNERFYTWHGVEIEYPGHNMYRQVELKYFLGEIEQDELYEKEFRKMLKELKRDEKISYWELRREEAEWDEIEYLRLVCK